MMTQRSRSQSSGSSRPSLALAQPSFKLLASRPRITSSLNSSIPQLLWWITKRSRVPSSSFSSARW